MCSLCHWRFQEVFVTGSKSCTESITLSMEAKKWARRYTVNAVVSTRHLPSRVLSSLVHRRSREIAALRANQPGHLAGKVQSHFGGGRGVRGGHEKFIFVFHVRVNIYNTVVLSSTVALYDTVYTVRVRISTVQHRDGSLVYSSSATVLYVVCGICGYVYYGMGIVQYSTVQRVPGTLVYRHIRHSRGQSLPTQYFIYYVRKIVVGTGTRVPVQSS